MKTLKKDNLLCYFFIIVMYIFVFQDFVQQYIGIARYFDELLAIMIIPLIIVKVLMKKQWKIKKIDLIILSCLLGILIIGIYANFRYQYQPVNIVLSDILVFYKFFLVYYLFQILNKEKVLQKYSDKIVKHIDFIAIGLFLFTIINYIFELFPIGYRYGIMVNQLFYSTPTTLAAVSAFLLCTRIYFSKKINAISTYLLCIIIFTTLRIKAIGFIVVFAIISIYVCKTQKRITPLKIVFLGLICLLIAYQQIEFYFKEVDNSARSSLLRTSFEIANDYAPIGAGFATFASHFSGESYSPLYTMYGIQNVHGLTKAKHNFISDSFWPMILGQFGYLGTILYLVVILLIFRKIQLQYSKENKYEYIAKLTILAYLIISSTSESAFVNSFAIGFAIILAL